MSNPNEVNALFFGGESSNLFYQIDRSLRFDRAASAYLNWTPSVAGNVQKWTFSAWVKRVNITASGDQWVFQATGSGGTQNDGIFFNTSDKLCVNFNNAAVLVSTANYRDPGAWMNIVVAVDTTQFTPADRFKVYINGDLITSWSTATYPVQNTNGFINGAFQHYIGRNTGGNYFGCYMTEARFIDGVQSDPSSFGTTSPFTNEWQPIPYIGAYGTNGFYLNFSDNSNTTSTTLGKDYSGNGNNWTPNSFSVASGLNNDSVVDVPTRWDDGSNGRGNYPVFNNQIQNNNNGMITDGNLRATMNTGPYNQNWAISTIDVPSTGQWYFEFTIVTIQSTLIVGIARQNVQYGSSSTSASIRTYANSGNKNSSTSTTYGATYTTNDVIGIAVNSDTGEITFYKNGVSQGVAYNDLNTAGGPWAPFVLCTASNNCVVTFNAGQQGFSYTPPTGFEAINTFTMPLPAVSSGQEYCKPLGYTGNGFTQTISGLQFQPDLVWVKARNLTEYPRMVDSLRGATLAVQAGNNVAQQTETTGVTAFNADGFSLGTSAGYNSSGQTYASWNFLATPTTVNNTSGSISSQTRSNATAGFSIVKYTGTGVNATVGHGAGATPVFMIIKDLTGTNQGVCFHASAGPTVYLPFRNANADTEGTIASATVFNNTAPSSTQFSVGTSTLTNAIGNEYIAYVWAAVPGFCAYGSYSSSADLPYVHCGFLPSLVTTRADDASVQSRSFGANLTKDDQRSTYGNSVPLNLSWSFNTVENSNTSTNANGDVAGVAIDLISSGWKLRGSYAATSGGSGNSNNMIIGSVPATIYWVAWGRSPAKFTNAR